MPNATTRPSRRNRRVVAANGAPRQGGCANARSEECSAPLSPFVTHHGSARAARQPPMTQFNSSAQAKYGKQDYTAKKRIEGVEIVELKRFNDDGGAMTELGRLDGGIHKQLPGFTVKQFTYSVLEPLAIKAFHLHTRQTDVWYVPPSDKLLLVLADFR